MLHENEIPVGNAKDLTNQQFGRLTVLYRVKNPTKSTGARWRCRCSCGKEVDVMSARLLGGNTKSCGCLKKESTKVKIGQQFNRLTVLEDSNKRTSNGSIIWGNVNVNVEI